MVMYAKSSCVVVHKPHVSNLLQVEKVEKAADKLRYTLTSKFLAECPAFGAEDPTASHSCIIPAV